MFATARRFSNRFRFGLALLLALLSATTYLARAQDLDFALPGLNDQPVKLASFRGRWVVVNFWASWCSPCLLEMPELQAFHEAHHDRAAVVGINFEAISPDEVRTFVAHLGITFPILLSGGEPVAGFELKGLPTTFLISPAGKLVEARLGTVNAAMLAERLTELEKAGNSTP
ncbi:MAG TPA: TlpA disulfide reductase family protein [Candidatus Competibacter sp.]|nr:TlpA disulfide reductase family protein [Candidatus Competibacter sp.]